MPEAILPAVLEHLFVPVMGGELSVYFGGSGKPVVLLHKLGGHAGEWAEIATVLLRDRKVVIVEFPGHGKSRMAEDPPLLVTHAALAGMLSQVLDWIEIDQPVDMVGSSVGGSLALAFGAMLPDRVDRIVSLGASWGEGQSREQLQRAADEQAGRDFDSAGVAIARSLEEMAAFGLADQAQADAMNEGRRRAGKWLWTIARSVASDNFITFLGRLRSPVTLAYGSRGHYGKCAREGAMEFKDMNEIRIDDASAFPHEDRPEPTLKVIREALA